MEQQSKILFRVLNSPALVLKPGIAAGILSTPNEAE
jgi:hypothetical protein